jgi:ketosteroid isomerase-like protein
MSQENVEIARRLRWAFENDADVFASMRTPESVWFPFENNHMPTYGIEGGFQTRSHWLDAWDDVHSELEEVVGEGENVVASIHLTGQGKSSGAKVDVRLHLHFKVREGKVVYTFEHEDKAAELEAVDISE